MASDGNWYPHRWQYYWLNTEAFDYPQGAVQRVVELADKLGEQGWEMLNYTVHFQYSDIRRLQDYEHKRWSATAIFKRPIAP